MKASYIAPVIGVVAVTFFLLGRGSTPPKNQCPMRVGVAPGSSQSPSLPLYANDFGAVFPLDQIVVSLRRGTADEDVDRLASAVGGLVIDRNARLSMYVVKLATSTSVIQFRRSLDRLRADARIESAIPNYVMVPDIY